MEPQTLSNKEAVIKLRKLVEQVKIAMMATLDDDKNIFSRPMHSLQVDDDGNIWFFTSQTSEKVEDVQENNTVYLMYSHPGENTYMHVKGKSTIVHDRQKIDELWSTFVKAWFPEGKDDPNLCLLKVDTEEASYWDSESNKFLSFLNIAKAIATGEKHKDGEVGNLKL